MIVLKLLALSEKILKFLVVRYKETGKDLTSFEVIQEEFPDLNEDLLTKALYSLKNDGLITVFGADDGIYTVTILPQGIIEIEEDTLLKKGYTVIKEIRSLLP